MVYLPPNPQKENFVDHDFLELFYLIEQSISYKYWPLRIHLGLHGVMYVTFSLNPAKMDILS